MFKEVLFVSAAHMTFIRPSANTVVISVLDRSEEKLRPALSGFRDVLRLQFEDSFEEQSLAKPGSWPDEPSIAEHALLSKEGDERVPALSDARDIVAFLDKHHQTFDQLTLVVHCKGGISRSAAIAKWASSRYWAPITSGQPPEYASPRILRLLDKAIEQ